VSASDLRMAEPPQDASTEVTEELRRIYAARFGETRDYRNEVWKVLTAGFFRQWIPADASVLDLGCGYGEFINNVRCGSKFGMDLNPEAMQFLSPEVSVLAQDCSTRWQLADASLDVVFTSNFFEHLPDKRSLARTLAEAHRCLRRGGRLVALGPNIKYLPGRYWDFFDHYLPLTELSLAEGMETSGFAVVRSEARFLPYTMVNAPRYPLAFLRAYLAFPPAWRILGRQFLVVAEKR